MKIKTKKKMRLDELIKHIYDNDEANRVFIDDGEDFAVHTTSSDAAVNIERLKGYGGKKCISKRDTFTVEVEEELTWDYEFPKILEITDKNSSIENLNMSIHEAISPVSSEFYIMKDGKLHLIWSRESGLPESGVLEVDDE